MVACCVLHNLARDWNNPPPEEAEDYIDDHNEVDHEDPSLDFRPPEGNRAREIREQLISNNFTIRLYDD